jgi:DNA-binding transcriptional LysR family regulator
MDLRLLRIFVEVVRQGGFSRAASAVHATQSTVSKAVKQLEADLGHPLLERLPKGVRTTSAGEATFRRALALLAGAEDLRVELEELKGLKRGILRLGVPFIGADLLFARPLAEYRTRYPGVEVQLTELGSRTLEDRVLAGDLDLAASLLPVRENLAWLELRRDPIDLLVPADSPLAASGSVRFKDLAREPMILFTEGFALNPIILEACRKNRFAPRVAARTGQVGLVQALVAARLGVAFLPRRIALQAPTPGTRCLPLAGPAIFWHMAQIWRKEGFLSAEAKAWLALMRSRPGE